MRSTLLLFLGSLCCVSLLPACAGGDDDDSALTDDDDDTGPVACIVDGSNGSGGGSGGAWLTVPGWTTGGDAIPDYEVWVYEPPGLSGPATVAMLTSNPVPQDRAALETLLTEQMSAPDGLDAWADEAGVIFAFPVAGIVEQGQLAFRVGLDENFMGDALDAIGANYDIDWNSVHLFGRSGGGAMAIRMANNYSTRIASIMSLAGPNPFQTPPTWERPVAGLFIHDATDAVVSRSQVQATVTMFEDAGAHVETMFDYTGGHDWDPAQVEPAMADFFSRMCL